jgi:hypothetical protein
MKKLRSKICAVLALWATLMISGCATSLQPLVSQEARVDVPEIAGQWTIESSRYSSVKSGSKVRIERRGMGSHYVEIDQDGEKSSWHADTVKLGETIFVDLFPDFEADTEKPEGILVIATHVFFVIQKEGQELKVYGFDHAKLDIQAIEEGVAVASPRNQRLVFVAESKRLQEFFAKHGAAHRQEAPVLVLEKSAVSR